MLGQGLNSCWSDEYLGIRLNMEGAGFALILIERQELVCGVCWALCKGVEMMNVKYL